MMRWLVKNKNKVEGRGRASFGTLALVPLMILTLGACDELLEVDLPGAVTVEALNDPGLAETLVLGVVGDFECGLSDYIWYPGMWYELFLNTSGGRPSALSGLRSQLIEVYADPCASGTGPIWTVMQVPHEQAVRAIDLLNSEDFAGVDDRDALLATAHLYQAYSVELLTEQFCEITLGGGPRMSRAEGFTRAEEIFTETISLAGGAGESDLLAAAYVGRARARLNLGTNPAGVIADASNVAIPEGFELVATYDVSPTRRNNQIAEGNRLNDGIMPASTYGCPSDKHNPCPHGLGRLTFAADGSTVAQSGDPLIGAGVADPRVPVRIRGADDLDQRGTFEYRLQDKYPSEGSPIPFSTWREAQIMIAEAQVAMGNHQAAADIINMLRTNNAGLPEEIDGSAWPLPPLTTSDPAAIASTVLEDRRRELWMHGVIFGDKLRNGYPVWENTDEYGQAVAEGRCLRIPFLEETSNPNL